MRIPIPANKTRFIIKLTITALYPLVLGIKVFDPYRTNSHYFRRKATFYPEQFANGNVQRQLQIPVPVSPEQLELELIDKEYGGDEGFKIDRFEIEKMAPAEVWAIPERHRFMNFAIGFAQKAGHTPTGYYSSPDNEFLIQYMPVIKDNNGEELITPARIHRQMPRVQLSKRVFQQFSIPVRVAILSHEGCHFFQNTRSEKQADLCGLQYYLDSGFPTIEAVYATTKVFGMHPEAIGKEHVTRARDIIGFIDNYKAKKENVQV